MSENPPNTLTSSQQVKIVVIGDGSIGKTCLLTVFVEKSFPVDYIPTVFNTMEYKMKIEGVVSYNIQCICYYFIIIAKNDNT